VAAIQRNSKGAFVYVIKSDSTAGLQNVTVGTTDGNTSAVQGIGAGTEVATTGFDKLQDGAKVAVHNSPPAGQNGSNNNNNGQSQSSPNSTRGAAPGTSPSDSATPNNGTSSTGNRP
jgi:multidrug efflux system membrane fusion protein